jgi:hypothetical protein
MLNGDQRWWLRMLKSSLRHALIAQLLSPLFLSLMALGAEKPATCELETKSIVSRSASGVAQVSNLGDIEVNAASRRGHSLPNPVRAAMPLERRLPRTKYRRTGARNW